MIILIAKHEKYGYLSDGNKFVPKSINLSYLLFKICVYNIKKIEVKDLTWEIFKIASDFLEKLYP